MICDLRFVISTTWWWSGECDNSSWGRGVNSEDDDNNDDHDGELVMSDSGLGRRMGEVSIVRESLRRGTGPDMP